MERRNFLHEIFPCKSAFLWNYESNRTDPYHNKYLAEKKLFVNVSYLSQILNGRRGCSATLARLITNCISWEAKLEDYFIRKEK